MLDFTICQDKETGAPYIETNLTGKTLLTIAQLNKGTAFTREEREAFGLLGKLPYTVETLDEQVKRCYLQFKHYSIPLQQYIYLNNLHDKNQILFYKLLKTHLAQMLPIIYTPVIGTAVQEFSREYRQPRGLYIAYDEHEFLDKILENRTNPEIDLIVITDGEAVLGIGDQGVGGMDIPIGKLMVYSICGGIDPTRTLPIFLDVGTNNQTLINDPMYLGCRHRRLEQEPYDVFIHHFIERIQHHFPKAFIHWEDFGRSNARRLLEYYEDKLCTFNDDVQGTGAVTLAALLAATHIAKIELIHQKIIIFGAGTAGTGIADHIVACMVRQGLTPEQAHQNFWLVDRQGLLIEDDPTLTEEQKPYARKRTELDKSSFSLLETVTLVKPTALIGCSAQPHAFTQEIIETMARSCERPIIFPLSNPDTRCEAEPDALVRYTNGRALIATGTQFDDVIYNDQTYPIAQCNNALVFPGIGLGILAIKARLLSKNMIWAATEALSLYSKSSKNEPSRLLPSLAHAQAIAKKIAVAVAKMAISEGLAESNQSVNLEHHIESIFWEPKYLPIKKHKS